MATPPLAAIRRSAPTPPVTWILKKSTCVIPCHWTFTRHGQLMMGMNPALLLYSMPRTASRCSPWMWYEIASRSVSHTYPTPHTLPSMLPVPSTSPQQPRQTRCGCCSMWLIQVYHSQCIPFSLLSKPCIHPTWKPGSVKYWKAALLGLCALRPWRSQCMMQGPCLASRLPSIPYPMASTSLTPRSPHPCTPLK